MPKGKGPQPGVLVGHARGDLAEQGGVEGDLADEASGRPWHGLPAIVARPTSAQSREDLTTRVRW
jgi:hypothetical protein